MARKSRLTDAQWADIERRLLAGEGVRAMAREFKVSPSSISERFSEQTKRVKTVANQVIDAEKAFYSLTISEQQTAQSLINALRDISGHLAGAARLGAMTAHRLAGIANQQVDKLNEVDPLSDDSIAALKGIGVYTELSNKAAQTGLNLLAANKDRMVKDDAPIVATEAEMSEAKRKLLKGAKAESA